MQEKVGSQSVEITVNGFQLQKQGDFEGQNCTRQF